jgi:hypothetical protein
MYSCSNEEMINNFRPVLIGHGYFQKTYRLYKANPNIPWPDVNTMLKFCDDNNLIGEPCHFGGRVEKNSDDTYTVTVYID